MASSRQNDQALTSPPPPSPEERAHQAVQRIIQTYALEAMWPTQDPAVVKNLIYRMASDIARLFGKKVEDISLEDLGRAQGKVAEECRKFGLHRVTFGTMRSATQLYEKSQLLIDFVSHAYWLGNLFVGNFAPALRKWGLKWSGAPLARAAGVWLAGQALSSLYLDPSRLVEPDEGSGQTYHPIFDALTLEQYRELALLMGIDGRISWDHLKFRREILATVSAAHHNKMTALWAEVPSYRNLLLMLCGELEVPNYQATDSDEALEERLVQKVLAESVNKLSPDQLKSFEGAIKRHSHDNFWSSSLKSTLMAGGLIAGRTAGLGLYMGASGAMAALGLPLASTALSGALSTVFGPVGIGVAAAAAAFQWTKARPRKALPFVLYLAAARGRLQTESTKRWPVAIQISRFFRRLWLRLHG